MLLYSFAFGRGDIMKKICLLLALIMCLSVLSSCAKYAGVTSDETGETTETEETKVEIVPISLSEFTLVRSEKADGTVVAAAQSFRAALNEVLGGTIEFKSDFYVGELEYYGREILFGNTNRPESVRAYEDLGDTYKYIIRNDGEHIVIAAKPEHINEAANVFLENIISGTDVLFGKCLDASVEYPIKSLSINGVDIKEYSLVVPENMSNSEVGDVEWLSDVIYGATGKRLSVVKDSSASSAHEIVIGTARGQSYSNFGDVDFVKKTDGKHLYLGGTNYWANIKAIYSFIREDLGIEFDGTYLKEHVSLSDVDIMDKYSVPDIELSATCNMGSLFNGTERMIAETAAAGMNRITVSKEQVSKTQTMRKFLQLVTYYEIRVLWIDNAVKSVVLDDYTNVNTNYWNTCLECPMTVGHFIWDEPRTEDFDEVAAAVAGYRTATGKVAFTNLFPAYADPSMFGGLSYEQHVRKFIEMVQPTELWVDIYPFYQYTAWEGWVDNVSLVAQVAREEGIPFGIYIQACPYSSKRTPTYEDFSVQLYTSLAFGAKNIEYFIYTTMYPGGPENFGEAIIDKNGNQTERYAMVQELNSHIMSFADVYGEYETLGAFSVNCKVGTYAWHSDQYKGFDSVVSLDTDDSVLVGCFEKQGGGKALMLVNLNDLTNGEAASVRVKAGQSLTVYQQGEAKTLMAGGDGYVSLTLAKGEGVFVVIN